jgi:Transposase DDE domain/Insertion element 4 transposase N-terminal
MDRCMPGNRIAHPRCFDPIAYVRGLQQLITQERLEYLLARTGRLQRRKARLLASNTIWLVIAISLFATHSIPMVWRVLHPYQTTAEPDESTFTKARRRLGVATLRLLFHEIACSLAPVGTPGVFYRSLRLMGLDGTVLDMPDTPANERIFGRGGNQRSPNAFPQVRVLALCELGTHAVCDFALRPINHSEQAMVPTLMRSLQPGMLLLWDRNFFGFDLIQNVLARGSHLLARVKTSQLLFQRLRDLPDGSYLTKIYPSSYDRTKDRNGRIVRLIEYTHNDPTRPGCGERHRLLTDLLDPGDLPAREAPLVYHKRWDQELVFDELKTHLNGRPVHLRSKTPRGVVQELYGLFLAHRVLRQIMSDAAELRKLEPDRLSFLDSLRILQSHLHEAPACSLAHWYQRLTEEVSRQILRPRRNRWYPRVIRRKMKKWDKKRPTHKNPPQPSKPFADSVVIT